MFGGPSAPRRRRAAPRLILILLVGLGVASSGPARSLPVGATGPGAVDPSAPATVLAAEAPVDLGELLQIEGDQVVMVPDGTYHGVRVEAPHPETDGPLEGWLVLQAENRGGAVVTGDLVLDAPTSRIMFVGFRFEDARVFNHGDHLAYWYTDHVYPDVDWYAAGRPIPRQFFVRHPATDIAVFGSDFHDGVASAINVSGTDRLSLTGVRVYDLGEPPGSDPEDLSHINTISLLGGDVTDMVISHSSFVGARANHQTDHGDVVGLRYEDVWYEGAFGSAFQFNATNGHRIVDGARVDVRSWGHTGDNPQDRLDIVDGQQLEPAAQPDKVDVVDEDVVLAPPPTGAVDPALAWRDEHPYDSWLELFGWTRVEPVSAVAVLQPDDRSALGVVAVTGSVVVLLVVAGGVLIVWRRRRRWARF